LFIIIITVIIIFAQFKYKEKKYAVCYTKTMETAKCAVCRKCCDIIAKFWRCVTPLLKHRGIFSDINYRASLGPNHTKRRLAAAVPE